MMVGNELVEVDGPNLLTDGNDHEAKGWGEWVAHRASPSLSDATLAQSKGLHIKRRREKGWDIFDDYFPCDIRCDL